MEIFNKDISVLGDLTLNLSNATGNFLSLDGTNIVKFRTPSEVLSDIGGSPLAHTHLLANVTDITALPSELNLLDLSALTSGFVLSADTATTASWKQLSHTLLSDIGSNTHLQIDTHIADSTVHFTESSINITESQISDLQSYSLTTHNHSLDSLTDTTVTSNSSGEILKWSGTAWVNNTLAEAGISSVGHTHTFASLTSKPTTIGGYGITDYDSLWDTRLGAKSTTNLTEGTNLYYTDLRVGSKITTDVNKTFVDALNLDAATLDGLDSAQFLRSDIADTKTAGDLTFDDNVKIQLGTSGAESEIYSNGIDTNINLKSGDLKIQNNGTTNLSWNGKQLSLLNTETILTPAIQIGENGRDTFSYGVGITTAMTHTSVDFNAYCDYNLINPTILEAKGYGAFDASPRLEGTNPINHFYGYQARQRWANSGTLPTTSIFNSMSGFMNGPTVEAGVVENVVGFLGNNTTGAGSVLNQYGVYIRELTKGSVSNYGIYSLNDNYLKTVTSDEFTGGGSGLINVDAETLDGLNSPQFIRSDVDTYFSAPANGGVNIMENSYLFFGDDKEVDLGFGGANDMYFNLNAANNLFIRNNSSQIIATFAQSTGNFTSSGTITSQGTGTNTFSGDITVPAEPYSASWTTNEVPTKNDVYDKIESLSGDFITSDIADTKTAGDLTFNDNIKIQLGTGGAESEIYSDATNTNINLKSGDLKIKNNGVDIIQVDRVNNKFKIINSPNIYASDGRLNDYFSIGTIALRLFNNSTETTTGTRFELNKPFNSAFNIGYHNGSVFTPSIVVNTSGRVSILNSNDIYDFDVTGTGRFTGDLTLDDNAKLSLGTGGAESEIYSDGVDTKINLKSGDLKIQDNGVDIFRIDRINGTVGINLNPAVPASYPLHVSGTIRSSNIIFTQYLVADLPTATEGMRANVIDATTTTFHSVVAGGGSNFVPVFYDGTNWRIG